MALYSSTIPILALLLALFMSISKTALTSDPDILLDFVIPLNCSSVNGKFFTYTRIRKVLGSMPSTFKVTKTNLTKFPALNGRSMSQAML